MGIKIPAEISAGLNDDRLEVGSIFFTMVYDTKPPKEKYFVVVGFTKDSLILGNVYINSEINPNRFPSSELKALHLPISVVDCPFLKWNSFVDCSEIYSKNVEEIKQLIEKGDSPYVGSLPSCVFQNILLLLQSAITIPLFKKRKFGIVP